ncbi:MAG: F0F1 ATP synthase subunit B [Buchnera aphidicola (Pentalonia nigronervosa)]|uniref:ATP synthase subunit b n=1 Tax=Buchnera aphidicola (Pentalonia nigronervosa) TaxID=1309793 RepID=A0A7H1AZ58_9GAMM|nr:MAG: F0F1 ATP synthase subunit B [Buchnera aphidicola (Pentalonia nigronervosa)]
MNLNATIFGQIISFFLFSWFCMRYVWPPIIVTIQNRQKKIEQSLIAAEQAKKELEQTKIQIQKKIQNAKEHAEKILYTAKSQGDIVLATAQKKALSDCRKMLINTQSEIDVMIMNEKKKLYKEITVLSILMAEKIIKKQIQNSDSQIFVNELISSFSKIKS